MVTVLLVLTRRVPVDWFPARDCLRDWQQWVESLVAPELVVVVKAGKATNSPQAEEFYQTEG